jgi:hypothetical protein
MRSPLLLAAVGVVAGLLVASVGFVAFMCGGAEARDRRMV